MTASPIFAEVFAAQWPDLPSALLKHYANRPFTTDRVTVVGRLDIHMHPLMKALAPLLSLTGMLTPWPGEDVPCTVQFLSEPDGKAFVFDRQFTFSGNRTWRFRSRLVPLGAHDVIEYMRCGIGWRCGYSYEAGRVVLTHKGYVLRLFGMDLPLPGAGWLAGRGEATEAATGDDSFAMSMALRHPVFGRLCSYEGAFTVTEMRLE